MSVLFYLFIVGAKTYNYWFTVKTSLNKNDAQEAYIGTKLYTGNYRFQASITNESNISEFELRVYVFVPSQDN